MHFSLSHAATPAIDSSALVAVLTPSPPTVRPLEKIQHTGNFYFLLRGCEEERLSSPSGITTVTACRFIPALHVTKEIHGQSTSSGNQRTSRPFTAICSNLSRVAWYQHTLYSHPRVVNRPPPQIPPLLYPLTRDAVGESATGIIVQVT